MPDPQPESLDRRLETPVAAELESREQELLRTHADLAQMHEEILQRMELLDVLYAFAPQVQTSVELDDVIQVTASTVQGLLAGDWCALATRSEAGLELLGGWGPFPKTVAAQLSALLRTDGDETEPRWVSGAVQPPFLVVPALLRGAVLGWIIIGYPEGHQGVTSRALELAAGIGRQAAIALDNSRMVQQIRQEQSKLAEANAALRQREAELELLNARLAEATRLKSEFLARMSHELRTPLNAIIGFSEALLAGIDGPLNDDQRESLTFIHTGGQNLLQLINDLLDLSKIEAGKLTIQPEDLLISDLLAHTLASLRPLAERKGLGLNLYVDPALPVLFSDPQRLRQIVTNLVGNAIKFTSQGAVRVTAAPWGSSGWELEVADTGIGIPAEKLQEIFDEFTQVESGPARREGGTGLGLAICRRLSDLLCGRITVDSQPGSGSTFRVQLPLRHEQHVTAHPGAGGPAEGGAPIG